MMQRTLIFAALFAAAVGAFAQDRPSELTRAYDAMVATQRALEDAKQRRDQSTEPDAEERIGTAKGASQLLPQYFERQRSLERDVVVAERRYERAVERWNAVR